MTHENVVRVEHTGDLPDGRHFIMYEFLDGQDLEQCMADHWRDDAAPLVVTWEVFRIDVVAAIVLQLCRALNAAHPGIVHRDIKPANIVLIVSPRQPRFPLVKLLDFGIAKMRNDLRATGVLTAGPMGTWLYMSPEQVEFPSTVDHRADIWAVGCMLYRLLTGQYPYPDQVDDGQGGKRAVSYVENHAKQKAGELPPMPSTLRRDLDPRWDAIIMRCLAYDRAARYPDVRALARDIAEVVEDGRGIMAEVWPDYAASDTDHTVPVDGPIPPRRGHTPPPPVAPRSAAFTSNAAAAGARDATATSPRPSRWLAAATAGVLVVVVAAVVVLVTRSRGSAPRGEQSAARAGANDARLVEVDVLDAAPAVAVTRDAAPLAVPIDAGALPAPVDAGVAPSRVDAGPPAHVHQTGTGTLRVVVLPFAEIFVDGKHVSSTPATLKLSATRHSVRLVGPSKTETIRVKITANRETTISRDWESK